MRVFSGTPEEFKQVAHLFTDVVSTAASTEVTADMVYNAFRQNPPAPAQEALIEAVVKAYPNRISRKELIGSATFHFARAAAYAAINIYMIKMASVFMIKTSTIAIYTGITPRWLALLGFALALSLLFGSYLFSWSFVVFPLWVFLISICILVEDLRR